MAKSSETIRAELRAKAAANANGASEPTAESRQPLFPVEHSEREPDPSELRAPPRHEREPGRGWPEKGQRLTRTTTQGRDIDRTLPHSQEAEQGVLGSMLISPRTAIPEATRAVSGDFFYVPCHQTIFLAMVELYNDQGALDLITFTQYLRDMGHLATVGGPAYVTSLFTFVPTAANLGYYIDIVRDKFTLRQIIAGSTETVRRAYEEQEDVPALLELAHRKIEDVKLALAGSMDDVEGFGFEDLLKFDPKADPDNLVGHRWLCRGFTCLWAGASGVGKSTLEMQLAIYWGCGLPIFGMKPVRPLKSLIIQAENDLGDTGEQLQGVLVGIAKAEGGVAMTETRRAQIESNVVIVRVIASTGAKFCALLESLVQMHKPDFVWIDPLFAFAGCDLIDAKEAGLFLRENLFPIAVRNRVCIHVMHHVGKPDRDSKAKAGWTDLDFQYLGFGSSEIQNGFRAVNIILPVSGEEKLFRLILSKRGSRAGAKQPDGEFTNNVYLTHAKEGICWLQVEKPDEQLKSKSGQFVGSHKAADILAEMSPVNGQKTGDLFKHMATETGMSRATFYRLFDELKKARKIRVTDDGWIISNRPQTDKESHGVSGS